MKKDVKEYVGEFQFELYESPRLEVIEMEIEGPILQMSAEDSDRQDW